MSVPVQHPMYIDGQFVTWHDDAWIDVVNPATEEVISRIPDGRAEDARKAIDAAERAQPEWEALPGIERANWLRKISAGIRQRASEISALIVAEGGKIQQLADVEVAFTACMVTDFKMPSNGERKVGDTPNSAVTKRNCPG